MHFAKILQKDTQFEVEMGARLRSWALPLLITWTPSLQELAIGPFYISRARRAIPF